MSDRPHEHVPTSVLANMSGHADRESEGWHLIWQQHDTGLAAAARMVSYWRDENNTILKELELRRTTSIATESTEELSEEVDRLRGELAAVRELHRSVGKGRTVDGTTHSVCACGRGSCDTARLLGVS